MSEYDDEELVDPEQTSLFGDEHTVWAREWKNMPEYVSNDVTAWQSVVVHLANSRDVAAFAELVGQRITPNTRYLWWPEMTISTMTDKRYADDDAT